MLVTPRAAGSAVPTRPLAEGRCEARIALAHEEGVGGAPPGDTRRLARRGVARAKLVGAAPVDEGHLVRARIRHCDLDREGRAAVPAGIHREVVGLLLEEDVAGGKHTDRRVINGHKGRQGDLLKVPQVRGVAVCRRGKRPRVAALAALRGNGLGLEVPPRLHLAPRLARPAPLRHAVRTGGGSGVNVDAVLAHRVRVPVDFPRAAARRVLSVARLGASELVGAARADHARLRAREQLVAADVRIVAAIPCCLALLEASLLEHVVVGDDRRRGDACGVAVRHALDELARRAIQDLDAVDGHGRSRRGRVRGWRRGWRRGRRR
mmetsp:Transcript_78581/g.189818  ORF Transcript_78581/g.189818 Transcript_78581/m.189818 type:complete len:322 (-) Transcript_78581:79-1044(-)